MPMQTSTRATLCAALSNEETLATALLAIVLDAYGTEAMQWEPETLWRSLLDDFGVRLPAINQDKLQAIVTCYTTNLFYQSPELFTHVCHALNDCQPQFDAYAELAPEEALWGMYEVHLNTAMERNKGEKPEEYSDEVRRYLGVVLKTHGVTHPPDLLRIAIIDKQFDGLEQWTDDADMFQAIYDKQQTDNDELLGYLAQRLGLLVMQLDQLPLQHRDEKRWSKLRDELNKKIPTLIKEREHAELSRPS